MGGKDSAAGRRVFGERMEWRRGEDWGREFWRGCCNSGPSASALPRRTKDSWEYDNLINPFTFMSPLRDDGGPGGPGRRQRSPASGAEPRFSGCKSTAAKGQTATYELVLALDTAVPALIPLHHAW